MEEQDNLPEIFETYVRELEKSVLTSPLLSEEDRTIFFLRTGRDRGGMPRSSEEIGKIIDKSPFHVEEVEIGFLQKVFDENPILNDIREQIMLLAKEQILQAVIESFRSEIDSISGMADLASNPAFQPSDFKDTHLDPEKNRNNNLILDQEENPLDEVSKKIQSKNTRHNISHKVCGQITQSGSPCQFPLVGGSCPHHGTTK